MIYYALLSGPSSLAYPSGLVSLAAPVRVLTPNRHASRLVLLQFRGLRLVQLLLVVAQHGEPLVQRILALLALACFHALRLRGRGGAASEQWQRQAMHADGTGRRRPPPTCFRLGWSSLLSPVLRLKK